MGVWDATTPTGSEAMSSVDDRIRELKTALVEIFRGGAADGTEAKFPGSSPSTAPIFRYRGLKGTTAARPAAGEYGLYFNQTKNTIERDNGTSWDVVGTHIPATTVAIFFQASAPVGWTQVTSQNDKALRVVSGTGGGTGGVDDLSTPPSTAHTHSITTDAGGAHLHYLHNNSGPGTAGISSTVGWSSAQGGDRLVAMTGGGFTDYYIVDRYTDTSSDHTHTGTTASSSPTAFTPKYVDVILCSKD